jgi:branched-chain amino acid transport system ATP-binding protein
MSEPLLQVRGLTKRFGGLLAVQSLDFDVHPGEIVGLIGPNGAGKTTVFNMITGMYPPSAGEVAFGGENITGAKSHRLVQRGLVRTFQLTTVFAEMTVLENIVVSQHLHAKGYSYFGSIVGTRSSRRKHLELEGHANEILELVGIGAARDKRAEELPHGHQRLLEIAIALATQPRLLMLDEPVTGMNVLETTSTVELVKRIRDELGLTILMIEHDMKVVMGVCDRIVVIDFGAKIAEGVPADIRKNAAVVEAYLGGDDVA